MLCNELRTYLRRYPSRIMYKPKHFHFGFVGGVCTSLFGDTFIPGLMAKHGS